MTSRALTLYGHDLVNERLMVCMLVSKRAAPKLGLCVSFGGRGGLAFYDLEESLPCPSQTVSDTHYSTEST